MNFIAVLAALGLEQWRAFRWRAAFERALVAYARWLEEKLNAGNPRQGLAATVAALLPPVLIAAVVHAALGAAQPLLALAWDIALLYLLMGFRHFSHAYTDIVADCVGSRRAFDRDLALARMRQEGVRVVTREMVVFEWLGEADTPIFRAVSKEFFRP